ncbi:hypothetical protein CBM2629_B40235 [Cupriavidus taiwanensis]|nr:hypothetical protein CBM2629_B40235 [Cupriavidus taiwanensis]
MRYLRTALRQLEQRCGALKMCQVIQGESQRDSGRARHWLSECRTPRRFFRCVCRVSRALPQQNTSCPRHRGHQRLLS